MKNYIFFIGGSGARTYRAFLHLCATGVIQGDELNLLLLDADNAAAEDYIKLYEQYKNHYDLLHQDDQKRTEAFSSRVRMQAKEVISPVKSSKTYLEQITEGDTQGRRVMSWLYTEEERRQDLRKGFYSHPNIGCVFFQNLMDDNLNKCIGIMKDNIESGEEVKVILVGSVFGGTGAAGIPSLLKFIHGNVKEAINKETDNEEALERLHFCGILITPYFRFMPADKKEDDIIIEDKYFLYNTKEALKYYDFFRASTTTEGKETFQAIYLVGQKTLDLVNRKYASGGKAQKDKSHIVEVYSAMAIKDFLENNNRDKIYMDIIDGEVKWQTFEGDLNRLADMVRLQAVLQNEIYPYIARQNGEKKLCGVYQWYKVYDLVTTDNKDAIGFMQEYTQEFWDWIYNLQITMNDADRDRIDPKIHLCGPIIMDMNRKLDTDELEKEKCYGKIRKNFNEIVDTSSNIEFVLKKIQLVLSYLGVLPNSATTIVGCAGLFMNLLKWVAEKE